MSSTRARRRGTGASAPPRVQVERDPDLERFGRSLQRSRGRRRRWIFDRRRSRRLRVAAGSGLAVAVAVLLVGDGRERAATRPDSQRAQALASTATEAPRDGGRRPADASVPDASALASAWQYARGRGGLVSVAVIDSDGGFHGLDAGRSYVSASVVKALLLGAELRRLEADGAPLDARTRGLLERMVTVSDNDAADAIYLRVGDAGLYDVARRAGMEAFSVSGYWGNAQITAADMARFMWRLEEVLAGPHAEFARGLLGGITGPQRWGIPAGAGDVWSVRFKGGWRTTESGALVHQAAELRADGERLAMAVLSDGQPSHAYATETLRGIADRLVGSMSREPWDGEWR